MKKIILLLLCSAAIFAEPLALPQAPEPQELDINNRILAKVNGKTLSVLDVVKKMDVILSRYYPQYLDSKVAKYQFYSANWRSTLEQLILNELMMADAESREIKVTDGEVREEVQQRFGPNVMTALDTLHLSYEEARKMVQQDMIVQRMNWFRVHSKALQKVNLQDVKEAYRLYCEKNPPKETWKYQLMSIRSPDSSLSAAVASKAEELIAEGSADLTEISNKIKEEVPEETALTISVSQDYEVETKDLSESHRTILAALTPGLLSQPVLQTSRDQSTVYRIFALKDKKRTDPPKFEQMASELKDSLLQKAADEEMNSYVTKLHLRFGYDDKALDIPAEFEPFTLR